MPRSDNHSDIHLLKDRNMNALVRQNTATAIASNAYDPFAAAGDDMGGTHGVYMKFNGNSGEFTYGQDQDELPEGTELAVDMNSFRRGWICWKAENVVDEQMTRVIDGPPKQKSELPDHGPYIIEGDKKEGWVEQAAVNFRSISDGKEFIFKVSSISALRALGTLLKDYGKDYKNHPGELPIVPLGTSSFMPKNKQWGKKYSPKLLIKAWVNEEELAGRFGDNASAYAQGGEADEGGEGEADASNYEQVETVKTTPPQTKAPTTAPRAPNRRF